MKFSFQEIFTSEETYLNKLKMLNEVHYINCIRFWQLHSCVSNTQQLGNY